VALLDGLARHLHNLGLVTFDDTGTSGDTFIETMPQTPDQAVGLFGYGGPEMPAHQPYDMPSVQIRVRGTADPRVSRDRLQSIYEQLHGLHHVTLPDGTYLVDCVGIQSSPQALGVDGNNRHSHVINFRCEVQR
jgi:hypothetical protein